MVVVTIAVGLVELLSRALMQNISDRTAKFLAGHHDKLVATLTGLSQVLCGAGGGGEELCEGSGHFA